MKGIVKKNPNIISQEDNKTGDIDYVNKNGKVHGQGTLTYADGPNYVGEFKDGNMHGQGTYTSANGDKYLGEFIGE